MSFIRRNLTVISLALSVLSGFVSAYNFGFWRGNAHERFWQDMYEACEERLDAKAVVTCLSGNPDECR